MFQNLKMGTKLTAYFLLVGIIPLVIVGVLAYNNASNALHEQAFNQLVAIRETKKAALTDYFSTIKSQIITMSENKMTIMAMKEFNKAFQKLGNGNWQTAVNKVQQLYINDNPNPTGSKELLDFAPDGSEYSALHKKYHPVIRDYLNKFEYYDIFLVNKDNGHIVYTVFKELDYGTSITNGQWASENISIPFKKVRTSTNNEDIAFVDFEPYGPSHGYPASFIASPIVDEGETIGVLMFQMPLGRLCKIMNQREGMGETGETYLVGQDNLMRSDSYLDPEGHSVEASFAGTVENNGVDTEATQEALSGQSGENIIIDYNGNPVLSAYSPFELFDGVNWAILAEIDEAEAFASIVALRNMVLLVALIAAALIAVIAYFTSRKITEPILKMNLVTADMAKGQADLSVRLYEDRDDELGILAKSFNEFLKKLENKDHNQKGIQKDVQGCSGSLNSATEELSNVSTDLIEKSKRINSNSDAAASSISELKLNMDSITESAEENQGNMNTVASSIEEMTATISEIALSAERARAISTKGVEDVKNSMNKVNQLGNEANSISKVIQTINDIADQTKLLALNATIEAARAGEAGKGFSVVANEVKELALQTNTATDDIRNKIESIQEATNNTVTDISTVNTVMIEINDMVNTIASAVEEQNVTTKQIADVVSNVVTGAKDVQDNVVKSSDYADTITQNMDLVGSDISEINESISKLNSNTTVINNTGSQLKDLVSRFDI